MITTDSGAKKIEGTDNWRGIFDAHNDTADALEQLAEDTAIIVNGNKTSHTGGAASGQYVLVRNSTITDITDGLYTAAQAIPANTAIDKTYLTAVSGGGLNALNSNISTVDSKLTGMFTRKQRTYSNVTIPSTGYIKVDSYSDMGVSTSKYNISMTIRGWSGDIGGVGFGKSATGTDFYLTGTNGKTVTSITIEYVFSDF